MRLGVKPAVFFGRLLLFFFLTYFLWRPLEPIYTQLLATLTGGFLHATEISSDPNFNQVTEMRVRETSEGRQAIFYQHRRFPAVQSGIPAEWVQANLVFLRRNFRGRYLMTDAEVGLIGRDILNHLRLLLDGPAMSWEEHP